ncbi:Uu.00g138630.m01.CDS01 [Anthostomella pinea]|uniref:Uu.00g138630.m01.CDS01 n=1 Tax=Anthostomella pinea TaxID=933095 RepID=A0AAI8YL67_9PEZI|nr:Uu.00g138630.m01.CDS01 [Anthostomella pinea]
MATTTLSETAMRSTLHNASSRAALPLHDMPRGRTTQNEPANSDTNPSHTTVPEGGYGWVALFACSVITWWFTGTTYSWGVIQSALVEQGLSQASTLSFVGSLTVSFVAILAIANAGIVTTIGARNSGLIGVSLLGLGGLLGSFATHNLVVPAQYFQRKRGLANGLVYASGGLGGAAISLIMEKLVRSLGPPWTFRVISILTLATGLPASWLIQERLPPTRRKKYVDWSLFTSLRFDLLFAAGVIATFPLFVPPFFLPMYCQSLGLAPSIGAAMVATFNASSAIGRIGFGLLCDHLGALNVLFTALLLSGPFSDSLALLVVFAIWNGAANGGFFAVMPTVVGSVFGSQKVPLVMGMVVMGWAGGYLMGGPIAGYLLAANGGEGGGVEAYRPAMYYAGSLSIGAAVLVAFMRLSIDGRLLRKV